MSKLISLSLALLILILLFILLPFRLLPQLPPQGSRGLCVTCHWDKRDIPAHADIDFTDDSCLQCHNPHTHFGKPYLPSIDSCLICHYEYRAKPGYFVHEPVEKKQCTSCHQPHRLFEASQLTVPLDKLCLSCHRDDMLKFEDPVGHMPYELNQCLSCHEAHMTREPDLLRQPLAKLCASCHRMEDEWNRAFQHMPFERDLCMDCHLPHASAWDGLIRQDQTRLCYSCHFDRPNELNRPITHGPYGEGQCTACHEPHSSVGDMLLPHEQEEEFCFMCHDRIKKIGWFDSPHSTVFEDEDKSCGACHEHHSSYEIFLSRFPLEGEENLCLYCHGPISQYYFDSGHGLLRCGDCHEIHGAMYDALLLGPELEVCAQCHPGLEHSGSNHPVGEIYTDDLRSRALLCSSCHGPHGTEYTRMRIMPANELCMACHTRIQ